jgi:hypothetical protein
MRSGMCKVLEKLLWECYDKYSSMNWQQCIPYLSERYSSCCWSMQLSGYAPCPFWSVRPTEPHLMSTFLLSPESLSPCNPRSSSLSLHYSKTLCLVIALFQAPFSIIRYAMHLGLRLIQIPSQSSLHSLNDNAVWIGLSICSTCQLEVVKSLFSEYSPL